MNKEKEEWDKYITPQIGTSDVMQRALDWWHGLPIQNLYDMDDSWVGYLWKYFPKRNHPYHLTGEEILYIYQSEGRE